MALVKQFFTFRFSHNGNTFKSVSKPLLDKLFPQTNIKYEYICGNKNIDGRHLAYIEVDDTIIPLDIIAEGLQQYSYHAKTNISALDHYKYITGDTSFTLDTLLAL